MNIPRHVAIIPDGNRRWARKHNLPASLGHEKGADVLKDVLEEAFHLGITCLSFCGLSLANLQKRSKKEVQYLERIFEKNFKRLAEERTIHEEQVRIRVLGEWESLLGEGIRHSIRLAMKATEKYNRLSLNVFIAYDGTIEMLAAIERIVAKGREIPKLTITPELVKENLLTCDLPPVDLLIRTGGETHLSAGFMMWETTESQLYFSEKYWPEFTGEDFKEAIRVFQERDRRLGR
ncbi:MAG: di-trans,poly-cis-decaprenylcistransferase [Chloroflexi bacterium]|nr:di-trans,poly-cis-decaprenylcistransferase [Chloroflexota bacterium]